MDAPPTVERLDLSQPTLPPGRLFRLHQYPGVEHDPRHEGCHVMDPGGGALHFQLDWPDKRVRRAGASFILRLRSETTAATPECPITVSVRSDGGEHVLTTEFEHEHDGWYNRAWYLPGRILHGGLNEILFRLDGGNTHVFVQRASIALFWNHEQEKTNWCWSAVTSNIAGFYEHAQPVPQPEVIHSTWDHYSDSFWGKALKQKIGDRDFAAANLPWFAHLALKQYGILRPRQEDEDAGQQPPVIPADDLDVIWRPLTYEELQREAGWLRPVVACIRWSRGGNHFIVITGLGETAERMVAVQDPWGGEYKYIRYETLRDNYNGDGRWFYTCCTRPPEPPVPPGDLG